MQQSEEDEFDPYGDHYDDQPAISIASEPSVDAALDAAIKTYRAADDMYQAAARVIARSPLIGTPLSGTKPERRVLKLLPVEQAKNPVLLVRYYLEAHKAIVDRIEFLPHETAQSVSPSAYVYQRRAK